MSPILRVNWSNPLTRALTCAWSGGLCGYEAVARYAGTKTQPLSGSIGSYKGRAFYTVTGNGTSSALQIQSTAARSSIASGQDFTCAGLWLPGSQLNVEPFSNRNSSTATGFDFSSGEGGLAGEINFRVCTATTNQFNMAPLTGYNDGKFHTVLGWRQGTTIYAQGDLSPTVNSIAIDSGAIAATQALSINARGANYFSMPVGLVAIWLRALSPAERESFINNPWQLFQPQRRSLYALPSAAPTITISPASLPDAACGAGYSTTLSASGGVAPYTFAVVKGSPPQGGPPWFWIWPNSVLVGIPLCTGPFPLTISATDSVGNVGMQTYTLKVNQGPPYEPWLVPACPCRAFSAQGTGQGRAPCDC